MSIAVPRGGALPLLRAILALAPGTCSRRGTRRGRQLLCLPGKRPPGDMQPARDAAGPGPWPRKPCMPAGTAARRAAPLVHGWQPAAGRPLAPSAACRDAPCSKGPPPPVRWPPCARPSRARSHPPMTGRGPSRCERGRGRGSADGRPSRRIRGARHAACRGLHRRPRNGGRIEWTRAAPRLLRGRAASRVRRARPAWDRPPPSPAASAAPAPSGGTWMRTCGAGAPAAPPPPIRPVRRGRRAAADRP